MLKQRLLTAIILISLIVWVLTLSSQMLAGVLGLFVLLGAYEWAGLCSWHTWITRSLYVGFVCLGLFTIYGLRHEQSIAYILIVACLWWLLALPWVWYYQQGKIIPTSSLVKAVVGFFILLSAWTALLILHEHARFGGQWLLFLFVLIWVADSSAYVVGKRWGHKKLADKVSPGKTWEGVIGALLMSSMIALSYALWQSMSFMTLVLFLLLCLLTVIMSIVGDLLESVFKRQVNLKDSGQILPGHGGVLDRIDSLTSAAPIFVMGLFLLGHKF